MENLASRTIFTCLFTAISQRVPFEANFGEFTYVTLISCVVYLIVMMKNKSRNNFDA